MNAMVSSLAPSNVGQEIYADSSALDVLERVFGYSSFHETQKLAIDAVCEGRDCLVLMPTGGGKSLCYQIPSLLLQGTGVVVSPLIALMEDQVSSLLELGVTAAYLNSSLAYDEQQVIEKQLLKGELQLLYVAPERLLTERLLSLLSRSKIALFAIDEAHCVSQWGHDFRKEYQQLRQLHERFSNIPRIALTATADVRTRQEIVTELDLAEADQFIDSFDRENIHYQIDDGLKPLDRLWQFLQSNHPSDSGIVYCLSRKKVEKVADWIATKGRVALPYHAGMTDAERRRNQNRFQFDDGVIIVATVAFGMGIDKPDVRFVAHLSLPKSIEAYYQETGRAGRDGDSASAWMSFGMQDLVLLRQMVRQSDAVPEIVRVMQSKLESMMAYTETIDCRRKVLLAYFDEEYDGNCGACDNCLYPPESWDATEAARKALSCIYRTGQRFGVGYLTDVLLGRVNHRIESNGHAQLSTYGIGRNIDYQQWRILFRQLLAFGFVDVDHEGLGVLKLNESCRDLLKGKQKLKLRRVAVGSKSSRRQQDVHTDLSRRQQDLFEQLRILRLDIARTKGVPPFTVFNDRTLKEMAKIQPTEELELGGISGVGAYKIRTYGQQFLDTIAEYIATDRM